ncbi:hypothetical protein [Pseudoalteromonas rubra]|nr:hypothetical protein [Pseudoalteromonas rubra]
MKKIESNLLRHIKGGVGGDPDRPVLPARTTISPPPIGKKLSLSD